MCAKLRTYCHTNSQHVNNECHVVGQLQHTHTCLNTWTQKCTHTSKHTRTCKHAPKLLLCYPSCAKEKSKLSDENFFGLRRFKNIFVGDAHDGRPSIFYSIEKQRQPLKSKSFPASARTGAASADIFILRLELFPLKI